LAYPGAMRSARLPSVMDLNPLSAEVERLRAQGQPFVDLTATNPTRCGLAYPESAILAALGSPELLSHRPDARGLLQAREAVAAHHGHGVAAGDLLLTASTSEAYSWLFKLLCDPGDQVLVPSPSYPLFHWLAALEGVEAVPVPAIPYDGWALDFAALERNFGPRVRAVVVVNPNNPTGHFLSRAEWAGLLAFCAARGLALLVDEVFADYALEPRPGCLPTALETAAPGCPLFILSGLSKVAALPQIKLGWVIARGPEAAALLEPLAFIADQYLSVSAPAQVAAAALLDLAPGIRAGLLDRCRTNLAELDRALAPHPHLSRLPVEGGWSVLVRRPDLGPGEACAVDLLTRAGVLVHPGHFFDLPGESYLVLSLLAEPERFAEGIRRLVAGLA